MKTGRWRLTPVKASRVPMAWFAFAFRDWLLSPGMVLVLFGPGSSKGCSVPTSSIKMRRWWLRVCGAAAHRLQPCFRRPTRPSRPLLAGYQASLLSEAPLPSSLPTAMKTRSLLFCITLLIRCRYGCILLGSSAANEKMRIVPLAFPL